MNQLKQNIINFCESIFSITIRDVKIQLRNLSYITSILIFFIITVLIFIFGIGPNEGQLKIIGIPIMWTILILSSTITVNK